MMAEYVGGREKWLIGVNRKSGRRLLREGVMVGIVIFLSAVLVREKQNQILFLLYSKEEIVDGRSRGGAYSRRAKLFPSRAVCVHFSVTSEIEQEM